jgi:NAD(P)-dependent dehydrogenase (short-subunit alcohol dehydrogenase family)
MGSGLEGKTALVTGASQGIGLASARALAEDGAAVVIMGRREEALAKACDQLRAEVPGARIEMFVGDAADEDQMKAALALAHGLAGKLDIIASIVGEPAFRPLLLRDLEQVRRELDTNFITAYLAVRHGAPLMQSGGAIVCCSSAAATQAGWGLSIYAAAKAAVERFVRAAAFELGGAGIRVNAVRPGLTLPPERAEDPALAPMVKVYEAETPLGRVGLPEDVARVVRFLAGPESGWVTGQTFSADGGLDQGKGPDPMDAMYGKDVMDQVRAGREPGRG